MNWVKVEDRPPALGEMVLVTIHGSDIRDAGRRRGMDRGGRLADGGQAGRLGTAPGAMEGGKQCD